MKKRVLETSSRLWRQLRRHGVIAAVAFAAILVLTGTVFAELPALNENCNPGAESIPTSPFIVTPFVDALPVPGPLPTGWRENADDPGHPEWYVRGAAYLDKNMATPGVVVPGPGVDQQDIYGHRLPGDMLPDGQVIQVEHAGRHQVWPTPAGQNFNRLINWPSAGVEPLLYHIRVEFAEHNFTNSRVKPILRSGRPVPKKILETKLGLTVDGDGTTTLPSSGIYGFNGTFPGPMINYTYGQPVIVRFENDLDENPLNIDRQNFGAPDLAFLTHLHNGHQAPESDGQPNYMQINDGGYVPGDWYDALYLGYPAGGDPSEIQSFLWFHDHRMHHTGANVYKGMVGLMPHYDRGIPTDSGGILAGTGLDTGNESDPSPNLKLPGVRTDNPDGTFKVDYDIPLAFYDVALDDGVTRHMDQHIAQADCGQTHPEWWGKSFFKHYPNHGFVGDIFTVNGKAYPVLHVSPRKYRLRFLDASVSRIYELALMTSAQGPIPKPGTQGQWQIPDGKHLEPWTFIASMGGLLPTPASVNSLIIWPATRREVVVDFSKHAGKTIYIANLLQMPEGRKPVFNDPKKPLDKLKYKVPLVKIVVDGPTVADNSVMPVPGVTKLRDMPQIPDAAGLAALPHKEFKLQHTGKLGLESSWVINSLPFDPLMPLTTVNMGEPEVWTNTNGGGGWVHPMHMHMEEHTVLSRKGSKLKSHPEDAGKEDLTNLEPSESVTFYRNFRTFTGRYVAHCHNLAHEDHNMMFGWDILPPE